MDYCIFSISLYISIKLIQLLPIIDFIFAYIKELYTREVLVFSELA